MERNLTSLHREFKNRVTSLPNIFSPYSVLLALKVVKWLISKSCQKKKLGRTMKNTSNVFHIETILGLQHRNMKEKYYKSVSAIIQFVH